MFACCFQVMQGGNACTHRDRLTGACSGMRGQAEANRLWKRLVGFPTGSAFGGAADGCLFWHAQPGGGRRRTSVFGW